MNIINFAKGVLNMNKESREIAVTRLKDGLINESKWNEYHKAQVKKLVAFLESDSTDITDLTKI